MDVNVAAGRLWDGSAAPGDAGLPLADPLALGSSWTNPGPMVDPGDWAGWSEQPFFSYAAHLAEASKTLVSGGPDGWDWLTGQSTGGGTRTVDEPAQEGLRELAIVDGSVGNLAAVLAGVRPGLEVRILDPDEDGISQISAILRDSHGLNAIHLLSHGDAGVLQVGSTRLDLATLTLRSGEIAGWGEALDADGDLLFYGCDLAASPAGEDWLTSMAALTGADVAASDDPTGSALLGGDWILERQVGQIEQGFDPLAPSLLAYESLLASQTFSDTTDGDDAISITRVGTQVQVKRSGGSTENYGLDDTITINSLGGADTISVETLSGFTGELIINAGDDNDTLKLGDDFGMVRFSGGAGTDTIDITTHTRTFTVENSTRSLTSSDGSELIQSATDSAEAINAALGASAIAAIENYLDKLQVWVQDLNADAGLAELNNALPLLGALDDTDVRLRDIAELTQLKQTIVDFVAKAKAALTSQPSLTAVAAALDPIASTPGASPSWTLGVSTDYRGAVVGGALELLLDLTLDAALNDQIFSLNLGEGATSKGLGLTADVSVDAHLSADLSLGLRGADFGTAFLVPGASISLDITAEADLGGSAVRLGFLDLSFTDPSTLTLAGTASLTLEDADASSDLAITDAELLPANVSLSITPPASGDYLKLSGNVEVASGVHVGDVDLSTATVSFGLGLSGAGTPLGSGSDAAAVEFTSLAATVGGTSIDLLNFGNITASEVMSMLGGVLDALDAMADSPFLAVPVPYTGKTIGEILDYGRSFKEDVLDPLFLSGDILNPDANKDGFVSVLGLDHDGDGDVDAADDALAELRVGSIQDLVEKLAAGLALPGLTAKLTSDEVSFTIDFARAFGLGDGGVETTTQGNRAASTSEVQKLTFSSDEQQFRLVISQEDVSGEQQLRVTDLIDRTGLTSERIGDEIKAKLNALLGTETVVSVVVSTLTVSGKTTYESVITFDADAGDVGQLGFAGERALNFGTSLGDFAGFQTDGSFGMAAALSTSLTFGLDLSANSQIQITPPSQTPEGSIVDNGQLSANASFGLEIRSDAAIGIENVDDLKLYLLNVGGGSFDLAFGSEGPITLAWNATDADIRSALEGLSAFEAGDLEVSRSASTITLKVASSIIDVDRTKTINDALSTIRVDSSNLIGTSYGEPLTVNVLKTATDGNTSYEDLAADVHAAVSAALRTAGLASGLGNAVLDDVGIAWDSTGTIAAGGTYTAAAAFFSAAGLNGIPSHDLSLQLLVGGTEPKVLTGTLRRGKVLELGAVGALQQLLDRLLTGTGASVTVSVNAGVLSLQATGQDLEVRLRTEVQVTADAKAGVRLSTSTSRTSFSTLVAGVETTPELQVNVAIDNTAFTELALAPVPTPWNGVVSDDIRFTLQVNGTAVEVQLLKGATTLNTNLDDLVDDLQGAVDTALQATSVFHAGDVVVERLRLSPGAPAGNRIVFTAKAGEVTSLAIDVPEDGNGGIGGVQANGAQTALGYAIGSSATLRSKASEFFLEDVSFQADIGLYAQGVKATASLGLLGIEATAVGNLDGATGKFLEAGISLALVNPDNGGQRLTIDQIIEAIRSERYLFSGNGTGFVEAALDGELGLELTLKPAGALAGLPVELGSLDLEAGFDISTATWATTANLADLITAEATFTAAAGFDDILSSIQDLSFDDIIAGLQAVVAFIQNLEGSSGDSAIAEALAYRFPVIDRSISDLVDLSSSVLDFIAELTADPSGSLQDLEERLRALLGLDPDPGESVLSFDAAENALLFNLLFEASTTTTRPFSLDLDAFGADLGGFTDLVGLSASGELGVEAGIALNLLLGVDLGGTNKAFYINTEETSLDAYANAFGEALDFEASLGPVGIYVIDGEAELEATVAVSLRDPGEGVANDGRLTLAAYGEGVVTTELDELSTDSVVVEFEAGGHVTLPLFYGLESAPAPLGDPNKLELTLDLKELFLNEDPTDSGFSITLPENIEIKPPSLFALLSDPGTVVKGLDRVFQEIQGVLEGQIFGVELPLIGDALADNPVANLVEQFRLDFLQPLAQEISESNLALPQLIELIQATITDVFGSDGLNLLVGDAVSAVFLNAEGDAVEAASPNAQALQFDFDLGGFYEAVLANISLDLGIPLLNLKGEINPTVEVNWDLHVGFGLDTKKGFYFVTDYDLDDDGEPDDELSLDLEINLGSTDVDPAEIAASLAILQLTLTDGVDLDSSLVIEEDEYTRIYLLASVDLQDSRGATDDDGNETGDGKLTLSELIAQPLTETFAFSLTGGAQLLGRGELGLGGLDSGDGGFSLGSVLPSISADVIFHTGFSYTIADGFEVEKPEVALANVTLDLGDFIDGFAGDLLKTIGEILDPLEWLIGPDGMLNKALPVLSDLLGKPIRLRDLVYVFSTKANGDKVAALLDFVEQLYFLTDLVEDSAAADGALDVPLGDLILLRRAGGFLSGLDSSFTDAPIELSGGADPTTAKPGTVTTTSPGSLTLPDATPSTSKSFVSGVSQPGTPGAGKIEFPILDPATIFGLLMGKPADLFIVELPELSFEFLYRQVIPIIGPLAATFSGKMGARLDLGFGYDTLGIEQFLATDNAAFLLNGFFLNDIDPDTGLDRNEASLNLEIAVGAALSLGIATVGVEGGIRADVFFNLNDPDLDTKVRFAELASNVIANSGNPLAVFDIDGSVRAFLRAYIESFIYSDSYELASITLFEFEDNFNRPGVLGSQSGDTLTLNIGANAAARIQGNTDDGDETIYVKSVGSGTGSVAVWSGDFNVSEMIAETNPFTGVTKIIVDAGEGDDTIDLSGLTDASITIEIRGGRGNDTIIGGAGKNIIFGDDGDDTITGGGSDDSLDGGTGDDSLNGGGGDDALMGGNGDDTLDGGDGNDRLLGGEGNDTFNRSAGNDRIDLSDAGSVDYIANSSGAPTLDFSGKDVPLKVFIKDGKALIGWGKQNVSTETILSSALTFNSAVDVETLNYFDHMVAIGSIEGLEKMIGSSSGDQFYVQETAASLLTLDGGAEADSFNIYADPTGGNPVNLKIADEGDNLKDENVINIWGAETADRIRINKGSIILDADDSPVQKVSYTPPTLEDYDDQLILRILGRGGQDQIWVDGTDESVPLRIDAGDGDDTVTIGDGSVDQLASFLNSNANKGFGFGPLVVDGGAGHDSVIVDDSADSDDNIGMLAAFLEKREGFTTPVEVGVISGLGMTMRVPGESVDQQVDGRIEVEGIESLDVRLGSGNDLFVVGAELNLDPDAAGAGGWSPESRSNSLLPLGRLGDPEDPDSFGIQANRYTIAGTTVVQGGGGTDDIRILNTQALPDQQRVESESASVRATTLVEGDRAEGTRQQVQLDIDHAHGYFVLEFAGSVPSAEQSVVLSFDVSAEELKAALAQLRLVGGESFVTDVVELTPAGGAQRSFAITFSALLGSLPRLRALDTKLLVMGGDDQDSISVQDLRQPTYLQGGDDNDLFNINVEIGINGAVPGSAPVGLDRIPPQRRDGPGVQTALTVDGGQGGDLYYVYLLGQGKPDVQINLYDTGSSTDDASFLFGTDAADLFLLRAAAASEGLGFIAMINPASVPVGSASETSMERVNYRASLDAMKVFGLAGNDAFGIDDTRMEIDLYGGEGEDFFQVGQLYKSYRNATAGIAFADIFATIETTRGFLSNGISQAMRIFGGDDKDQFIVYHNLAPLALFGDDGDDNFLIRAFALVGSQEDLRGRTDVSGDAGADLIQYAVNAPVNIDGGDGSDKVIVIGTEFNDDFVVTENGVYGAGLNVQFTNVESVEVDGDAGDDRFFILGTSSGVLTQITGGLGSDTFVSNGPTPDVVSNDLLGHSGLISHSVDSTLADSLYAGITVAGIAANVADDDEPAVRILISDGNSIVSQANPTGTDSFRVVLARKPENGATVVVTSRAPAGVKFVQDASNPSNGVIDAGADGIIGTADDGDTIAFTFTEANWNVQQTAYFKAYQMGGARIQVGNPGGNGNNASQVLAIQGSEGSFRLTNGSWTTAAIAFDLRADKGEQRQAELDVLALAIEEALELSTGKGVTVSRAEATFFLEFLDTAGPGLAMAALSLSEVAISANDIAGSRDGFISHTVTVLPSNSDAVSHQFVAGEVAAIRPGSASVLVTQQGSSATNEVQLLRLRASDGNFRLQLGDQVSEEMLFTPADPETVRNSIARALNAMAGINVQVLKLGAPDEYTYQLTFLGESSGRDMPTLMVDTTNLLLGSRTLTVATGLPDFMIAQGDNILRGATIRIVAGAGVGQTRLVIGNTADTITVTNPWSVALDASSRFEILRYGGVVLPSTLVQIIGDDAPGIDLRASGGSTLAFEAVEVAAEYQDAVSVALTSKPSAEVTVSLASSDNQLQYAVRNGGGTLTPVTTLTFTTENWNQAQTLYVLATNDDAIEGLHKARLTLTANGGGYSEVAESLVVDIADDEVALAMVIESDGSTNVIETGNSFNGGAIPDEGVRDTYQIVLSKAITGDETVSISIQADNTRTQRGAGLLGIRAYETEVLVNGSTSAALSFNKDNWWKLQSVDVTAADDDRVDGDDSKSFAKGYALANSIEGELVINGGASDDRSADLEREPVMLPGETNLKASIGTLQINASGIDDDFALTIDLAERIGGTVNVSALRTGGLGGTVALLTNTDGDPGNSIREVQLLRIDAVSGRFKLSLDGIAFTDPITYDPANLEGMAQAMEEAIGDLPGSTTVEVTVSGEAFVLRFNGTANEAPTVVENIDLRRVGASLSGSGTSRQLEISGNGGSFNLLLGSSAATILFNPDLPDVDQAGRISAGLLSLGIVGARVYGSGGHYTMTFASDPSLLSVDGAGLRQDSIQQLDLGASAGSFKLSLGGSTTTSALDVDGLTANTLEDALAGLLGSGASVAVVADGNGRFVLQLSRSDGNPAGLLQVVDADLTRSVKEAIEANLGQTLTSLDALLGSSIEITSAEAKNKARLIVAASGSLEGTVMLTVARPWKAGLTPAEPQAGNTFTIERVNVNLLADESEETDVFYLNDTDNVSSSPERSSGALTITEHQLSGLGMGARVNYGGLEELHLSLGAGDNQVVVQSTHRGLTSVDAGGGDDSFKVESVSGQTLLHGGVGADQVEVGRAGLLAGINGLLTLSGDVPQAVVQTLGKGSAADPIAAVAGVDELQELRLDAIGGTFTAGFSVNGVRFDTAALDWNIKAGDLEDALQQLLEEAFGLSSDGNDVSVVQAGNTYRIQYTNRMGGQNVPLLAVNDRGLTMETGAGRGDRLLIDNSADDADTQALLTQTSLTGLGMGDFGVDCTAFNEIQTLRLNATGGSFHLSILAGTEKLSTGALAYDISAADLDTALESLMLQYLNALRQEADPTAADLTAEDTGGGLVEITRTDDVYTIRFVGLLNNSNVAQLNASNGDSVGNNGLTLWQEKRDGTVFSTSGSVTTATRVEGITASVSHEQQQLTIAASGGSFRLSLDGVEYTKELAHDISRADLLLALEDLAAIGTGDVVVGEAIETSGSRRFSLSFRGNLAAQNLQGLQVDDSDLEGGSASIATLQDGGDTAVNDLQVLTVAADDGQFRLELHLSLTGDNLSTGWIAYDASAETVRQAVQDAVARSLNRLPDSADLSRTREAFKTDLTVWRIGNTYQIGFQGVLRQITGGAGVGQLRVIGDEVFDNSGGAALVARMDGINYYGIEQLDLKLGSGSDVLNVQGTSRGSFKGINVSLDAVHAATNIELGAGDDRIYLSSDADLDLNSMEGEGSADVFDFLSGDLNQFAGNLNLSLGSGRHRLLISDEAATAGDAEVRISDQIDRPSGAGGFDDVGAAEIQIQGLAFGDISYGADADGDLFDGVLVWSGRGHDGIYIDGTHRRDGERTTTQLNTGLGDDVITVDLDAADGTGAKADGFFVLNSMGGSASHSIQSSEIAAALGGYSDDDVVRASASTLPLMVFGGAGKDDIIGGQAVDLIFGDFGRVNYLDSAGAFVASFGYGGRSDRLSSEIIDATWVMSRHLNLGDQDVIEAQMGDDVIMGGADADFLDGNADQDLIFGDAVQLKRRDVAVDQLGTISSLRYQSLQGERIYSTSGTSTGQVLVDGTARDVRHQDGSTVAGWHEFTVENLYHSATIAADPDLDNSFGDDYIAGGASHDVILAQLGNDVVQGDGSIGGAVGAGTSTQNRLTQRASGLLPVWAGRQPDGSLSLNASFEASTDGDDYIEGNGGDDVIFGNLGQDDIVGDHSSLFSLDTDDERMPTGADLLFGGAGTNIARNDHGDASADANGNVTLQANSHSRDADVLVGDNANIYRLVGVNGTVSGTTNIGYNAGFLSYNYDNYMTGSTADQRIIARAVELLDYTPGGADYNAAAANDLGDNDEIHGEAGDDTVYGMKGHDLLFGDGQDDDLIGGYGNDWISGGTGQDGVLGDDGRLFTSRNGLLDPLHGVVTAAIQAVISTPGKLQEATINLLGALTKSVDLTPFSQDPNWSAQADEWNGQSKHSSDDILYGGLGSDWIHAGSGDDAASGAEALPEFFNKPLNLGNVLGYSKTTGEFAAYDEYNPMKRIETYLLNFSAQEGVRRPGGSTGGSQATSYAAVWDDGDDKVFGDLGNDWLVGGTGRDHLYGGWGDDLLNADDDLNSNGGLNDVPDTHPTYEDRAFGGAGRDVLIANTGGDRLIDWVGEFNSYLVPFAPFGAATISRTLQPQLPEFLYALSASDGADQTRYRDVNGNNPPAATTSNPYPSRNGEPYGELGIVLQKDTTWQSQTGAPADPQAGNVAGGPRDVLRSSDFNTGTSQGMFIESGSWALSNGRYQVSAARNADALSVYHADVYIPHYFEVVATINAEKPTGGSGSNGYLIFDYYSRTDFKFAGINVSTNKLEIGRRTASGWIVDKQVAYTSSLRAGTDYNLLLAVSGSAVTLSVNNASMLSHTFATRLDGDGGRHFIHEGMVGLGAKNSKATIDNLRVQRLAPVTFYDRTLSFNTAADGTQFRAPLNGSLDSQKGRYALQAGTTPNMDLLDLNVQAGSSLLLTTTVNTSGQGGFVFDYYSSTDYKFVTLDARTGRLVIGHVTSGGVSIDASYTTASLINAGTDVTLGMSLKGSTVSVTLNGQQLLTTSYNALTTDGACGLFSVEGTTSFDTFRIQVTPR